MTYTLILVILVGRYANNLVERQFEFPSIEACQSALGDMRVHQVTNAQSPDPVVGICVPSASVGKSPQLIACEEAKRLGDEARAECNVQLSECVATKGQFADNPTECWQADLNGDGVVGAPDQGVIARYGSNLQTWFGQTCP
jgi:hypothetical protein